MDNKPIRFAALLWAINVVLWPLEKIAGILHIGLAVYALDSGWWAAILTLLLPGLAEIYWCVKLFLAHHFLFPGILAGGTLLYVFIRIVGGFLLAKYEGTYP